MSGKMVWSSFLSFSFLQIFIVPKKYMGNVYHHHHHHYHHHHFSLYTLNWVLFLAKKYNGSLFWVFFPFVVVKTCCDVTIEGCYLSVQKYFLLLRSLSYLFCMMLLILSQIDLHFSNTFSSLIKIDMHLFLWIF